MEVFARTHIATMLLEHGLGLERSLDEAFPLDHYSVVRGMERVHRSCLAVGEMVGEAVTDSFEYELMKDCEARLIAVSIRLWERVHGVRFPLEKFLNG